MAWQHFRAKVSIPVTVSYQYHTPSINFIPTTVGSTGGMYFLPHQNLIHWSPSLSYLKLTGFWGAVIDLFTRCLSYSVNSVDQFSYRHFWQRKAIKLCGSKAGNDFTVIEQPQTMGYIQLITTELRGLSYGSLYLKDDKTFQLSFQHWHWDCLC